jgi:hypothetical protein
MKEKRLSQVRVARHRLSAHYTSQPNKAEGWREGEGDAVRARARARGPVWAVLCHRGAGCHTSWRRWRPFVGPAGRSSSASSACGAVWCRGSGAGGAGGAGLAGEPGVSISESVHVG